MHPGTRPVRLTDTDIPLCGAFDARARTRLLRHPSFGPLLLCALLIACQGGSRETASTAPSTDWFSTWGTAIYTTFPNGPLAQDGFSPNTALFTNNEAVAQSFRMLIHPSTGGDRLRLRFSNRFGDRPLTLENVSVALSLLPTGPAIDPSTRMPVTFTGSTDITIPAGTVATSDPVELAWSFGDDIAVSFYAPGPTGPMSWHAEAFAVQYVSLPGSGDLSDDPTGAALSSVERGWFFLSGMDAQKADAPQYSVATFGDSITDGFAGTPELNHRYPDFLARRLQSAGADVGVVNVGINSNKVLSGGVADGAAGILRFGYDVVERSGIDSVFILLGTNDLSAGVPAETVYAGLINLAAQAHAAGICTLVGTILPRNDPPIPFGWDAATEEPERQQLNALIRQSEAFDAVADVASAMANPLLPSQPLQAYFVEGLHPNSVGMQVLAEAIPLEPLLRPPLGSCNR